MIETTEYRLTRKKYREFTRREYFKTLKFITVFTIISIIGVMLISIFGFIFLGDSGLLEVWLPYLGMVLFFLVLYILYYPFPFVQNKT